MNVTNALAGIAVRDLDIVEGVGPANRSTST